MALVKCNTAFTRGGESVQEGEVFDSSHPWVLSTPAEWWSPLKVRGLVEEATAKPGRKRTTAAPIEEDS